MSAQDIVLILTAVATVVIPAVAAAAVAIIKAQNKQAVATRAHMSQLAAMGQGPPQEPPVS